MLDLKLIRVSKVHVYIDEIKEFVKNVLKKSFLSKLISE